MKKIICTLITAFLLLIISIYPTFAEEINIVGELNNNLNLTIDNEQIFYKKNIMPGSEWATKMSVKNTSKEPLNFSLNDISGDNDDVSQWLDLQIISDEQILYSGNYKAKNAPYFTIEVSAMQTKTIEMTVNVNEMANNTLQGKSLHSVWIFEAQSQNDTKSTPVPIVVNRTTNAHSGGNNKHVAFIARYIPESIISLVTNHQIVANNGLYDEKSNQEFTEDKESEYYTQNISSEPLYASNTDKKDVGQENISEEEKINVKTKNKPVKTGNEHIADNTKEITDVLMILLPFIIIAFVLVWKRKKGADCKYEERR